MTICLVVARDQEVDVEAQLTLGVRMLQAQSHMCVGDGLTSCGDIN